MMAVWSAILLQVVAPLALIAWLAFGPVRSGILYAVTAVATGLLLAAMALVVPALILPWWLPLAIGGLVLLVTALRSGLRSKPMEKRVPTAAGGRLVLVTMAVLGIVGGWLTVVALAGRTPPDIETVNLPVPLGPGTYLVASGGSRQLVNGHMLTLDASVERFRAYRGQSYGVDLVEIDNLGFRAKGLRPRDPADYEIYGKPVFAPCAGRVVASRNDRPDMPVPEMDREYLPGNFVLLRCRDADVLLAHLVPGSVRVSAGDGIRVGDRLGAVGNSGQTAEPHLHISAQRPGPVDAPFSGDPLALRLDGRFVARNERLRVRQRPAAQPRR